MKQKQEKLEIEDDLSLLPEQTASFYKELQNAPVICDLKNVNAVGIIGEEADRFELLKLIVTDVALRHFAADVKLFFVAEKEHAGRMHLFRFLPGAYCVQTDTRGIVTDDESKTLIFEYLYKELTMRAQEKRSYPHLLIFFYDEYGYKKHPISQFTEKGKDLGVTFLFFGQTRADIPVGCDYVVQLSGGYRGVLINAAEKSKTVPFVSSQISDTLAVRIVRTLAPVCTDEVSLEGELIKNISMFKMLNILSVEDLDGFPGVVAKIFKPDLQLTLMEPTGKRVDFLKYLCGELGLTGVEFAKERAEEAARKIWREQFDVASARAVAALPVLCEYCLPLVRVGGVFIAMKGPDADAELGGSAAALKKLGGAYGDTRAFTLPDGSERRLVVCKKISQTPTAYPRNGGKIAKKPL